MERRFRARGTRYGDAVPSGAGKGQITSVQFRVRRPRAPRRYRELSGAIATTWQRLPPGSKRMQSRDRLYNNPRLEPHAGKPTAGRPPSAADSNDERFAAAPERE